MPNLHPKTIAALEAGPQNIFREWEGQKFRDVENWHEFARRIALIEQEAEREDTETILAALITENELALLKERLDAIRRRGKP